jgi:hypothetical protein
LRSAPWHTTSRIRLVGLVVLVVWLPQVGKLPDVLTGWDRLRIQSAQDRFHGHHARGELSNIRSDAPQSELNIGPGPLRQITR